MLEFVVMEDRFRACACLLLGIGFLLSACITVEQEIRAHESADQQILPTVPRSNLFWAEPPIIQSCNDELGKTTLHWNVPQEESVEIRVDSPQGTLFARGEGVGSQETGEWVKDRTSFYLLSGTDSQILDSCEVRVTVAGCPSGK